MQDINYDLTRLLSDKLKMIKRLEKYYIKDAEAAKCHSLSALKTILKDEKKHVDMLADEIKMRVEAGVFK